MSANAFVPPMTEAGLPNLDEKAELLKEDKLKLPTDQSNPVLQSCQFAYQALNLVQINEEGVKQAAHLILGKLLQESYTPRTWRDHPLHMSPLEPYAGPDDPRNRTVLNRIFFISALNFSFWSEKEGRNDRYGVEWRTGWRADTNEQRKVWTGYWSLVAAVNRAQVDDGIPICEPAFFASEWLCPDSTVEHVFRAAPGCAEGVPLLRERIRVLREVGEILCRDFNGSYQGFLNEFHRKHDGKGNALDLVKMITETFPSFRDEVSLDGQPVYLWKRAQILVAESWAAFFPPPSTPPLPHPLFPNTSTGGAQIHHLTMFADYRVPQILHHLRILTYPPELVATLHAGRELQPGCREELSLRAASVVAVERVRREILNIGDEKMRSTLEEQQQQQQQCVEGGGGGGVSSVLIDFYLWDLAKRVEGGVEKIEGMQTAEMVPIHRTRSIWY